MMERMEVKLLPDQRAGLKDLAAQTSTPVSFWVRQAIDQLLERQQKQPQHVGE
jgi:predicted transcriptional regulator